MLQRLENEGKIHGVKVTRESPSISHLMYSDDLVIFCRANMKEAEEISKCLEKFCLWSGKKVSTKKSLIHFSRNLDQSLRTLICAKLNMMECDHKGKYLGLPFFKDRSKDEAFQGVVDRLESRLAGWKLRNLS